MNTRSLKRHHVVSAGIKTEIKKSKSDKVHQNSGVNETSKGGEFLIFCQDSAQKYFQENPLGNLNCCTDPSNRFYKNNVK